jgi:signal transduction histidine kinase
MQMLAVRYLLPAVLVLIGAGCAIFMDWPRGAEAFSLFAGAGLSILLLNVLFRAGVSGDSERDDEAAARDYFAEHGSWPGENDEKPGRKKWNVPAHVATPESEAAEAAARERNRLARERNRH